MGAERKGRLDIEALKKIWGRGAKDVFNATTVVLRVTKVCLICMIYFMLFYLYKVLEDICYNSLKELL